MDSTKAKFSLSGLTLSFGSQQVLEGITLDISACSITSIIGPSGCGKTALLKCLNRMNDFSEKPPKIDGKILLDGKDIYANGFDKIELRKRVGMIFQQPNPLPQSIFDNVAYGPRIHGARRADLPEIVQVALEKANLWREVKDILAKNATLLSGGQQQRLCIARVLAIKPEVLLMDEPCSALDPASTQKIEDLMAELASEHCFVFVTHNIKQAQRVSEHMAFLLQDSVEAPGRLVEYGLTREMTIAPRDKRTEDYLMGRFG